MTVLKRLIKNETVLCVAAFLAAVSMFVVPPDKEYLKYVDLSVLAILFCLMAVVAGLKKAGLFARRSTKRSAPASKPIAIKL